MKVVGLPRIADVAESLVQTDTFMDALAVGWKLQRRGLRRVESGTAAALRLAGVPSRADVTALVNQIGGLQREVRELRREVEGR